MPAPLVIESEEESQFVMSFHKDVFEAQSVWLGCYFYDDNLYCGSDYSKKYFWDQSKINSKCLVSGQLRSVINGDKKAANCGGLSILFIFIFCLQ